VEMHGGISEDDRIANVAAFQNGEVDYFVSNTATGGTGIKLSRARMMVYMSNSFKYVDRIQSEERATDFINIGESVLIVDIVARGTVDDEVIQPALQAKEDIAVFVNRSIGKLKLSEGF
jgi:SNF2 family DNA or RNA helicase